MNIQNLSAHIVPSHSGRYAVELVQTDDKGQRTVARRMYASEDEAICAYTDDFIALQELRAISRYEAMKMVQA